MLAIGAVPGVAVGGQNRFGDVDQLLSAEESKDVGDAGEGGRIIVAHPKTATAQQIIAEWSRGIGGIGYGNQSEAIAVDIGVVQRRDGEGDFEFAREILFSVKRVGKGLFFFSRQLERLAINPNRMVGSGLRQEGVIDATRVLLNALDQCAGGGSRRRHDIPVYIAAGR